MCRRPAGTGGQLKALLLLLWGVAAAASSTRPLPLPTARALPCTPKSDAPCWAEIQPAERFASVTTAASKEVYTEVRFGWEGSDLLVHVGDLPAGATVELGLSRGTERRDLQALWPAELTTGTHRLRPSPPIAPGQRRGLRLNLLVPSATGGVDVLPWTPVGAGEHIPPAEIAFLGAPPPEFGLNITPSPEHLGVLAPGATRVRAREIKLEAPVGGRGVPAPWSAAGEDRIENATPPNPGWIQVDAEWHDSSGVLIDINRVRLWWRGPTPTVDLEGLHPIPKEWRATRGRRWAPAAGDRVCALEPEHHAAAELLVEEVRRFTGTAMSVVSQPPCDVRFQRPPTPDAATAPPSSRHPDAFAIKLRRAGVQIDAGTLRSAVWAALAVADLVGPDGSAPAGDVVDWPDVSDRVLYHAVNLRARPGWSSSDHIRFLRRVAARGRYTEVVLAPYDSFTLPGVPWLSNGRAKPTQDLSEIIAAARALGISVSPGVPGPAHAQWLTRHDPALADDVTGSVLNLRSGRTRDRVSEVYEALLEVFGGAEAVHRFHMGHDEVFWRADQRFSDERNPSTAGSPRAILLAESLRWHMDWAQQHALKTAVWSDTLLAGWNGAREGAHHAAQLLTEEQRRQLTVMSWAELGDPWSNLGARGSRVERVHTGYVDWKREGIQARQAELGAEGLAVFVPAPWAAFGPAAGSRNRFYFTGSVILAGTTAWDTDLVEYSIATTLQALRNTPALQPGLQSAVGSTQPMTLQGTDDASDVMWPGSVWVGTTRFSTETPKQAQVTTPVTIDGQGEVVSVLLGAELRHSAELALLSDMRAEKQESDRALGFARLHTANGAPVDIPLVYGIDLYRTDAGPWTAPLWHTSGVVSLSSQTASMSDAAATNRTLWRRDLRRPDGLPISSVDVFTDREGVTILVGAATSIQTAK